MKYILNKSALTAAGLLGTGVIHAHPGPHGGEGLLTGIVHMLGEHGYLLALLLGIGVLVMRRSGRV